MCVCVCVFCSLFVDSWCVRRIERGLCVVVDRKSRPRRELDAREQVMVSDQGVTGIATWFPTSLNGPIRVIVGNGRDLVDLTMGSDTTTYLEHFSQLVVEAIIQ